MELNKLVIPHVKRIMKKSLISHNIQNVQDIKPSDSDEEPFFKMRMMTPELIAEILANDIKKCTEENKRDYTFEGEHLYVIGTLHDFIHGWSRTYITKSGKLFSKPLGDDYFQNDFGVKMLCNEKNELKMKEY